MSDIPRKIEVCPAQELEAQKAAARARLAEAGNVQPPGAKDYTAAARTGAAEHPDHVAKAQGRAGERVALEQIKDQYGQAVDLNQRGANFPIYDVGGPGSVASVKVRGLEDGSQLSKDTLKQYVRDLEEAIGRGSGPVEPALGDTGGEPFSPAKFNNAARHLHRQAQAGDALPSDLAQSEGAAADYLRQNAELRIPSDHAQQVRDYLRAQLLESEPATRRAQAERLGLNINEATYREDVEQMLGRIKDLPISSAQLRAALGA